MGAHRTSATMMYDMTEGQHQLVYNFTSFTLASMMATTVFLWLRLGSVAEQYKTALCITGLVTFIAFYHYVRIFNSWVDAYEFPKGLDATELGEKTADPKLTGIPFNDAYRYMDWLLTVPLLLMELVLVMKFDAKEAQQKSATLGAAAALMILLGYPGELITEGPQLSSRWMFWAASMTPFVWIVYTLLVGLKAATESEENPDVADLIRLAQKMTVVSWCTYPFVYIIPMLGATGAGAVVGIQIGYCISDIISKCGVGLLTYSICKAKSANYVKMED